MQAEYIASLIAGKFKLPSQEEMLKIWLAHVYKLQYKRKKIIDVNTVGPDQVRILIILKLRKKIERYFSVTLYMFFDI